MYRILLIFIGSLLITTYTFSQSSKGGIKKLLYKARLAYAEQEIDQAFKFGKEALSISLENEAYNKLFFETLKFLDKFKSLEDSNLIILKEFDDEITPIYLKALEAKLNENINLSKEVDYLFYTSYRYTLIDDWLTFDNICQVILEKNQLIANAEEATDRELIMAYMRYEHPLSPDSVKQSCIQTIDSILNSKKYNKKNLYYLVRAIKFYNKNESSLPLYLKANNKLYEDAMDKIESQCSKLRSSFESAFYNGNINRALGSILNGLELSKENFGYRSEIYLSFVTLSKKVFFLPTYKNQLLSIYEETLNELIKNDITHPLISDLIFIVFENKAFAYNDFLTQTKYITDSSLSDFQSNDIEFIKRKLSIAYFTLQHPETVQIDRLNALNYLEDNISKLEDDPKKTLAFYNEILTFYELFNDSNRINQFIRKNSSQLSSISKYFLGEYKQLIRLFEPSKPEEKEYDSFFMYLADYVPLVSDFLVKSKELKPLRRDLKKYFSEANEDFFVKVARFAKFYIENREFKSAKKLFENLLKITNDNSGQDNFMKLYILSELLVISNLESADKLISKEDKLLKEIAIIEGDLETDTSILNSKINLFLYQKTMINLGDYYSIQKDNRNTKLYFDKFFISYQKLDINKIINNDLIVYNLSSHLLGVSRFYYEAKDYSKALSVSIITSFIQRSKASENENILEENEKLMLYDRLINTNKLLVSQYIGLNKSEINFDLPFFQLLNQENALEKYIFSNSLFLKNHILELSKKVNENIFKEEDNEAYQILSEKKKYLLDNISLLEDFQVALLIKEIGEIEKELNATFSDWEVSSKNINLNSLLDLNFDLNQKELLLDYFIYSGTNELNNALGVFVLNSQNIPTILPISDDSLIHNYHQAIISSYSQPTNKTRGVVPIRKDKVNPNNNIDVFNFIWKPLTPYLKDIEVVYYSPIDWLHKLPFNAIMARDSSYLSEKYLMNYIGSPKSLLIEDKEINNSDLKFHLFGGIDYGELPSSIKNETFKNRTTWTSLPGTLDEINSIHSLLQQKNLSSNIYTRENATESKLKLCSNNSSDQVMHIATHGYYLNNDTSLLEINNPLQSFYKSGIIMANGNLPWLGYTVKDDEDGLLSAYEISHLDFTNTALVVLSACESGLGDIRGSEGVYGLQRAFKMAGVRYIIMSLWKVPDEATAELMTTFYKYWLDDMPIREAFNKAQKDMRNKYKDPYYWGGFVLME